MNIYLIRILRFSFHCGKSEIKQLVQQYLCSLPDGTVRDSDLKYICKPVQR